MRRWSRKRAGMGAIIAFVIWVVSIVLIYALSQSQAQGDALMGVVRAAGLRSLQWAGRSALNEIEYKLRRPETTGVDPMETIRSGGTPSPTEPTFTLKMYQDQIKSGVIAIGSVDLKLVTPKRAADSKDPWYIDMTVKVVYRMGRTRLERRVRRRLVAYCQPMSVTLGPGAGEDATKGVFDATLVLEPRSLLEVMEQ
jgi:hypothetical protein